MSPTVTAAAREAYLEGSAATCPHCEDPKFTIRRDVSAARWYRPPTGPPQLHVPCTCAACAYGWDESYRLFSLLLRS